MIPFGQSRFSSQQYRKYPFHKSVNLESSNRFCASSLSSENSRNQSQSQMDSSAFPDAETQETQEPQEVPDNRGKRKTTGATSKPPKPKKAPNTRSPVWDNYTRLEDNYDKCRCDHCLRSFGCATSQGTLNLQNHLLSCKKYKALKESQSSNTRVVSKDGGMKDAKVSFDVFKEATEGMIVLAELPLAFVESLAYRWFCDKVNLYTPHSRRTATRNIVKMYEKKKAALKEYIAVNKQRVSLTTDIWVAQPTGNSYMVITAHFIDANWQLRKLIIGFKYVSDHKGKTISRVLLECLAEWGIEKIFTVTVDNATANTSVLKKFQSEFKLLNNEALVLDGELMHVRCCAHIINLIVKEGLLELDDNVSAIRNAVQYVRASTNRLNSFDERVDIGKISRGSLPLDVKTRWNSTYLMLLQAIKFKVAFDKMELEDKLYNDYFMEFENGKKRIGPPLSCDWRAVERLVQFLLIFYNSTLVVSASTSICSYKCYGEIVTIERNLMNKSNSVDKELAAKADDMREKFDKYWDGMKNINRVLIVASVFDPSKKMQFAKLCFERLYGKDTLDYKGMLQTLGNDMKALFDEYSLWLKKDSTLPASQSTQTSSSSGHDHVSAAENMDLVDDDTGYERMDFVYKEMVNEIGVDETRNELDIYLKDAVENPKTLLGTEYDVLSWWKVNTGKFPILSAVARDVLAMQVSSVASESAFSTSGRIVDPYRSCLTHYMIEVLMCTEQWMKSEIKLSDKRVVTNSILLADADLHTELEKQFYGGINMN